MAKYALLVIETGEGSREKDALALRNLANNVSESLGAQAQTLAEQMKNVGFYQIDLSTGLALVSHIHRLAEQAGFSVRTLFLSEEPSWVITPSQSST